MLSCIKKNNITRRPNTGYIASEFQTLHCVQCSCCVWLINTHTHTRLTALFLGLPRWAGTRKVKPIWILLKQETVSGISWAICKSASRFQTDNHTSTPPLTFLKAGCPSCRPTNSVKALKAQCDLYTVVCISWHIHHSVSKRSYRI